MIEDFKKLFSQVTKVPPWESVLKLRSLLGKGYFPKELPPPFNTESYAKALENPPQLPEYFTQDFSIWCNIASYSLARPGALRRQLAILHPLAYYRLALEIVKNHEVLMKLTSLDHMSLSTPKFPGDEDRAIMTHSTLAELPAARSKYRVSKWYVLEADIARFYPSIYTHTLDWAITGKLKAKKYFGKNVDRLGSRIDKLVQAAQGGQTRGIPIGPDTSLLLSEILLSAVDKLLKRKGISHGFRFIDDYEIMFENRSDAEKALAILEGALGQFELALNSEKTKIVELPYELDYFETNSLRAMPLRSDRHEQHMDIIAFFNAAFYYAARSPEKPILRFAVGKLNSALDFQSNAKLIQDMILQCATVEPGVWPNALPILQKLHLRHTLSLDPIKHVIDVTIRKQASRGHSSEVAWSLWVSLVFDLNIETKAVREIVNMQDNACCLLLLHAVESGLAVIDVKSQKKLKSYATKDQLYGENWLLTYEAVSKKWIKPEGGSFLRKDPVFKFLLEKSVSFYDESALITAKSKTSAALDLEEEPATSYGGFSPNIWGAFEEDDDVDN